MRVWRRVALAIAVLAPIAALGDVAPQVVLATPGSAGSNGGAIERFTMRFSEAMVPLGDPRATPPALRDPGTLRSTPAVHLRAVC